METKANQDGREIEFQYPPPLT